MLPIAILPAAGLLLGIGGSFTNATAIQMYPFLDKVLQTIFQVMNGAGSAIFNNLSLLLCIGLAKKDKGTAALAGTVGFFLMTTTISTLLSIFAEEGTSIDAGVIGALVVGGVATWLHNRY